MITATRITQLLASCLEMDPDTVSENASRDNTEGWDSIAHLTLLDLLEGEMPGVLDRLPRLAEAHSVTDIVQLINGE